MGNGLVLGGLMKFSAEKCGYGLIYFNYAHDCMGEATRFADLFGICWIYFSISWRYFIISASKLVKNQKYQNEHKMRDLKLRFQIKNS
jgi:hypothetical protein